MSSPQALAAAQELLKVYPVDHSDLYPDAPLAGTPRHWVEPQPEALAAVIDRHFATPNASLPPLDPTTPTRKMVITIEVAADFEKRLDNQWMVEREIAADRWTWEWADA